MTQPSATAAQRLAAELGRMMDEARHQPLAATSSVDTATVERWIAALDDERQAGGVAH